MARIQTKKTKPDPSRERTKAPPVRNTPLTPPVPPAGTLPAAPVGWALDLLAKAALAAALLYAIYRIWNIISGALFPVVTALVLSYLLTPFVRLLRRKGLSKGAAVIAVMFALFTVVLGFFVVLYPVLSREIGGVVEKTPDLIAAMEERIPLWIARLREDYGIAIPTTVAEAMTSYGASLQSSLPGLLNRTGSWAFSALIKTGGVVSGALNVVLVPVFTIFFLLGHENLVHFLEDLIPPRHREGARQFFGKLDGVAASWFRGQIQVVFVLALLYGTGLSIVFGLSGFGALNGFAVGALTGVLNIIPYVGVATGFILALAMALIEWNGGGPILGIALVFLLTQVSDGYFITPRIVGTKVGLSTVWVLIVLLVGGAVAGLLGMLFAVPVAALVRAAWPDAIRLYRSSGFYTRGKSPS